MAGCRRARKSTGGGLLRLGGHVLKALSSTQAIIALSSGEAEYYAMLNCGMAEDIGSRLELELQTDSTSTKGIVGRRKLGRTRPLVVAFLWLRESMCLGDVLV